MKIKDPYKVILFPLQTEKGVRLREGEGKLTFIVNPKATKQEIKISIERLFKVKVRSVNTLLTLRGNKKAYVKLSDGAQARDLATQLGQV